MENKKIAGVEGKESEEILLKGSELSEEFYLEQEENRLLNESGWKALKRLCTMIEEDIPPSTMLSAIKELLSRRDELLNNSKQKKPLEVVIRVVDNKTLDNQIKRKNGV